ncbi:response regulator transcription factor [uncultured Slackia sp.]|uniref:response regulator transcription factor n=1 Tax=uncultured Slackia sp. TaxID=665903 RepID=UPI0026E0BF4C|nr:helix-turn-helix transcriptional regulator [uncultured Slackia sp.]
MGVVQSRPNACVALCAFGSCLNLVWCTLMGHTLGFMPAADGMQGWTNPRAFFLAGILVISILFAAFPHGMRRWNRLFMSTLPLVASAGTACFALAYRQDLCDPGALAAFGLCVSGVGYFWLVARYNLLLARTQLFSCAVWSIVGALFAKLVLVEAFGASLDSGLQVGVAVALPIVSALVFEIARVAAKRQAERNPWVDPGIAARTSRTRTEFGIPSRPRIMAMGLSEKRDLLAIVAVAGILLAVVRAMSFLGMWGDTHTSLSESIAWISSLILGGVCLVLFARFALIGVQERPMSMRFQPAILVTLAGMFAMALYVDPGSPAATFLSIVVQLDELFAHLLFWCVVIAALDVLDVPSYRVIGFACAVYAGVSIAWVVLMSHATVIDTTLVLLAAYAVVVFAMRVNWRRSSAAPAACATPAAPAASVADQCAVSSVQPAAVSEKPAPAASEPAAADEAPAEGDATARLHALISQRCEEVADRYGLSPREREVFACMARGRTRAGIQEDLVLSGNTVKTHVAHIYAKLDVHDRQEMMALLLGRDDGGKPA